jgi:molecular chaperone DnaK (HSP70)
MNSIYIIVALLTGIALIGSTGASLQQQASAINDNWREEFRVLTDEFEDAVSNATDQEPPNQDSIQQLVDEYKTNLTKIFESYDNQTGML